MDPRSSNPCYSRVDGTFKTKSGSYCCLTPRPPVTFSLTQCKSQAPPWSRRPYTSWLAVALRKSTPSPPTLPGRAGLWLLPEHKHAATNILPTSRFGDSSLTPLKSISHSPSACSFLLPGLPFLRSTGNSSFSKVHMTPLCFCKRPTLVSVFANQQKSKDDF